jgi:hypothetical protein
MTVQQSTFIHLATNRIMLRIIQLKSIQHVSITLPFHFDILSVLNYCPFI